MTRTTPTDNLIDYYDPIARKRMEALTYVLEVLLDPTLEQHTREILTEIELRLK